MGVAAELISLCMDAGSLPSNWATVGAFAQLSSLNLTNNTLSGTLSSEWGSDLGALPALQQLDLRTNRLTGELPLGWGLGLPVRPDHAYAELNCARLQRLLRLQLKVLLPAHVLTEGLERQAPPDLSLQQMMSAVVFQVSGHGAILLMHCAVHTILVLATPSTAA